MSAVARFRYILVAGATAVVIGTGFTVAGMSGHSDAGSTVPTAGEQPLTDETAESPGDLIPSVSASPSVSAPASASASPSATPRPSATSKSPSKKVTKAATTKATAPVTSGTVAQQVLAHINAARTDAGLAALTLDANLSKASAEHTQLMIDGCGLAHECSGESGLGARFSAQGVSWSAAGENIGYGSSGSGTSAIVKAANGLTDSMLAEVPPNDGHRKNLLSKTFKRIGLSIVRDSKGVTWMTQDFVN
jgi:uncharacterized protein YkwD